MSTNNEDILKQIQELQQKMNAIMTTVATVAAPPAAAPVKPIVAVLKSPGVIVPVAEEKDSDLAKTEKIKAIFEQSANQDAFCKQVKIEWGMLRDEARQRYHDLKLAAKGKAPVAAAKSEVKVPPTVVVAPPPAAAAPVLSNAAVQGLTDEIKKVLLKDGQIPAIKFIREKTGMDLLPAKLWVDCIQDIRMAMPPSVLGAIQAYMQKMGLPTFSLNDQVQAMRKDVVVKAMDPVKAQAEKQHKIDIAGDNKSMLVQAARKVAREMGAKGPVNIDDVTLEMSKSYNVLPVKGKKQNWKGSVFTGAEWVFIGNIASRQVSSHGRPVGMWVLKTWLQENTLNGKETNISSFVVSRLYSDFKRVNPKLELKDCNCYMGDERVAAEIRDNIRKSGNRLYEVPVSWIPGAVGALILPPEPKKLV